MYTCDLIPDECNSETRELQHFAAVARELSGLQRLNYVNTTVNQIIEYTSDQEQWGQPDYWASPLETLKSHKGDCEDYVFLKLLILRLAGVALEDLRMVLVKIPTSIDLSSHALLMARHEGHWFSLDSRYKLLRSEFELNDYVPELHFQPGLVRQYDLPKVAASQ